MASIPRIVSTPLKWASRKALHATLLRFPGGDPTDPVACAYCPEMCRFACPTAVASGNDAVTPCNKMSLLYKEERWPDRVRSLGQLWPLYDCTGCGRCSEYCVYGVPVADRLFSARPTHPWVEAERVLREIPESEDPVGDLAAELGDWDLALRRRDRFLASGAAAVAEPKELFALRKSGEKAVLAWEEVLGGLPTREGIARLEGGSWLVCESVWLSRRLERFDEVDRWVERWVGAGAALVRPAQRGRDAIDSGGEGAYRRLFPDQARVMARELWERDRDRARGVITFSRRAAAHFRATLGEGVPVLAVQDLGRGP